MWGLWWPAPWYLRETSFWFVTLQAGMYGGDTCLTAMQGRVMMQSLSVMVQEKATKMFVLKEAPGSSCHSVVCKQNVMWTECVVRTMMHKWMSRSAKSKGVGCRVARERWGGHTGAALSPGEKEGGTRWRLLLSKTWWEDSALKRH